MGSGRRFLITGAQGFIGSRLLPLLQKLGHTCVTTEFDLLDFASADAALASGPWDAVVHLAAISHVPTCEKDPVQAFRVNLSGTATLLEAIRRRAPQAWMVFASTAQVYAAPSGSEIHERVIMDEDRRVAPQNVYARTKREAELLVEEAARRDGLAATVLRLFNHTHKTQPADFFLPHLYQSILAAAGKGQVPVGNLEVWRDIGSLQDLLQAFAALLGRPRIPETMEVFNVCSGSAKLLSKLARELARRMGAEVDFVADPERVRPGEPAFIQGSHRRLTEATGWMPKCADESELVEAFLAD